MVCICAFVGGNGAGQRVYVGKIVLRKEIMETN